MNQPNILILHLDQLRQDCLGCYGNPDVHTPNIDALAQDSVTYQNHQHAVPLFVFQQPVRTSARRMG